MKEELESVAKIIRQLNNLNELTKSIYNLISLPEDIIEDNHNARKKIQQGLNKGIDLIDAAQKHLDYLNNK